MPSSRTLKLAALPCGALQRSLRRRRRDHHRASADLLVRLRRAARDRHEPRRDRADRPPGRHRPGGDLGNVHVATGLLLSIPAVAGVVLGTAIQQRIRSGTSPCSSLRSWLPSRSS